MKNFRLLAARMSVKMHLIPLVHLDCFPENYGNFSEEQVEQFHCDISIMEERYQVSMGCQLSDRQLLVPEEGCGACSAQSKVPE